MSRSSRLGANDGGVDHQPFEIRLAGDSFKQSIEHAHLDPAIIAPFRRLYGPKRSGDHAKRARARYPQQRVKETSAIASRTALAFTAARNELLYLLPLIIPRLRLPKPTLQKPALNLICRPLGIPSILKSSPRPSKVSPPWGQPWMTNCTLLGFVRSRGKPFPGDQQLIAAVPEYEPSAPRKPPVGVPEQEGWKLVRAHQL